MSLPIKSPLPPMEALTEGKVPRFVIDGELIITTSTTEYDHFTGGRFRHGTTFLRWRPDKKPTKCGFDQLK